MMSELEDDAAPLPPTRIASVRNGGPTYGGNNNNGSTSVAEKKDKKTGIVGFFNKKGEYRVSIIIAVSDQ